MRKASHPFAFTPGTSKGFAGQRRGPIHQGVLLNFASCIQTTRSKWRKVKPSIPDQKTLSFKKFLFNPIRNNPSPVSCGQKPKSTAITLGSSTHISLENVLSQPKLCLQRWCASVNTVTARVQGLYGEGQRGRGGEEKSLRNIKIFLSVAFPSLDNGWEHQKSCVNKTA